MILERDMQDGNMLVTVFVRIPGSPYCLQGSIPLSKDLYNALIDREPSARMFLADDISSLIYVKLKEGVDAGKIMRME